MTETNRLERNYDEKESVLVPASGNFISLFALIYKVGSILLETDTILSHLPPPSPLEKDMHCLTLITRLEPTSHDILPFFLQVFYLAL